MLAARATSSEKGPRVVATLRVGVSDAVYLVAAQSFAQDVRLLARAPGDAREVGELVVGRRALTALTAMAKVHRAPAAIAVSRDSVWVAHSDGRVTRIPESTTEDEVDALPGMVGSGSDGQVSIAYGLGFAWVAKEEPNDRGILAKLDRTSVLDRVRLDGVPDNVAVGAGAIWVVQDDATLMRLTVGGLHEAADPSTSARTPTACGRAGTASMSRRTPLTDSSRSTPSPASACREGPTAMTPPARSPPARASCG